MLNKKNLKLALEMAEKDRDFINMMFDFDELKKMTSTKWKFLSSDEKLMISSLLKINRSYLEKYYVGIINLSAYDKNGKIIERFKDKNYDVCGLNLEINILEDMEDLEDFLTFESELDTDDFKENLKQNVDPQSEIKKIVIKKVLNTYQNGVWESDCDDIFFFNDSILKLKDKENGDNVFVFEY